MNDWHIQSRAHACQACGRHFSDKQPYHTLLSDQKTELLRQDICVDCWTSQHGHGSPDRKGFISHWQGIYETPPAAPPEAIQKETAETLLRKLVELNDAKYVPSTFVLAVMLERKRLLKVKEQLKRDGQRIIIYEHAKNGDLFTIADPNLQLNHIEQVQHDVAQLLEHGLPTAPASQAPVPADATPPPEAPAPETIMTVPAAVDSVTPAPAPEFAPDTTPVVTPTETLAPTAEVAPVPEAPPEIAAEPVTSTDLVAEVTPPPPAEVAPPEPAAPAATPESPVPGNHRRGKRRAQP